MELQIILMFIQVFLTLILTGAIALFTASEFFLPDYQPEVTAIESLGDNKWKISLLIINVGWGKGEINEIREASRIMGSGWKDDSDVFISRQPAPPIILMPKFFRGNSVELEVVAENAEKNVDFMIDISDSRQGRVALWSGFSYEEKLVEGPLEHLSLWIKSKIQTDLEYEVKK